MLINKTNKKKNKGEERPNNNLEIHCIISYGNVKILIFLPQQLASFLFLLFGLVIIKTTRYLSNII